MARASCLASLSVGTSTSFSTSTSHLSSVTRSFSSSARPSVSALRFHRLGAPLDVLQYDEDLPSAEVGQGQVKVELDVMPIHPSDLSKVQGWYPSKQTLPAVGGSEGLGRISEVGPGVESKLSVGQPVIFTESVPTWTTETVVPASAVLAAPEGLESKPDYAATLSVNPSTAYRLLEDFVDIQPGDVILQNGANSAVGQTVIQLARDKGAKTINIIRAREIVEGQDTVERMKAYGAYIVAFEGYVRTPEFRQLISDLPSPKLALDCVGGSSATEMARLLGKKGTMVTYGGMSRKPVQLPTSVLIHNDIRVRGFWLEEWQRNASEEQKNVMLDDLTTAITQDRLRFWIERHRMSEWRPAIEKSLSQRNRKVVLTTEK